MTPARATAGKASGEAAAAGRVLRGEARAPVPATPRPVRAVRMARDGASAPAAPAERGMRPTLEVRPIATAPAGARSMIPTAARSLLPVAANRVGAGPIPAARTAVDPAGKAAGPTSRDPASLMGSGRALPATLRARLAPIVGARAADVARIHTGPAAHARAIQFLARAVADGVDVFFADGEYRPGTRAGDALIAHEVAHVDQALRGLLRRPAAKAMGNAEHSALEAAADKAGDHLSAGADIDKHKRPARERKTGTAGGDPAPATAAGGPTSPTATTPAAAATTPAGAAPMAESGATGGAEGGAKAARGPAGVPPELPHMPEPATELSAKERGRVDTVEKQARGQATATATAPAASENVAVAQAAVAVPQKESDARAAEQVVVALIKREPPSPEIVALCERIKKLIADKRPADEAGVIDSRSEEVAKEAGGKVGGDVQKNVDDANASYGAINAAPAGPAPAAPPGIQPIPEAAPAPPVGATAATPDAVPPAQVNLDADGAAMDTKAKDAGLEEETAQLVQSGPVADARDARGEMKDLGKDGPAEALKQQKAALGQANADMAALQAQALASLKATRTGHVTGVKGQQEQLKGGEEALRAKLAADANTIFTDAQKRVQDLLTPVHGVAMKKWSTGLPLISKRFNDDLKVVKDKIDERHSGVGGFFVAGWDAATGLPGWVTRAYDTAEKNFGDDVCTLITDISSDVNTVIKLCDDIIAEARRQIGLIFTTNLPDGLKDWAAEQQKGFDKKLDQLHDKAEATRTRFNKELIDNAGGAVQAARERIQKLRTEAKGLWGRFLDALGRFLDDPLKFIIDGLLELVGISPKAFWALIDKISQVISDIAWHPVRFISNLMDGVGAGFDLFFKNFAKHLKKGFFDWLFSGLKDLGVEVPPDFSLKSIITFFLQLMGISWARIRKMLADVIGEKYVAAAEKALKLVEIIAKGPQGILDFIKDKLTPEALLERVLDMAIKYVVETLIKQVGLYIIKLLNPVGAVLAAIETIYKVIKWIFHNAARIFHFIEAIVNALAAVIAGDISVVAAGVEKGLAMLIPPVIDFLAELIGLGDLPDQIAKIVKGLQAWVEGIIKSIIKFLADSAKSLLASLGIGGKDGDKKDKAAIGETLSFTSEGESHKLYIAVAGTDAKVMVASSPMTVATWLDHVQAKANALTSAKDKEEANRLITLARKQLGETDSNADEAARIQAAPPKPDAPAGASSAPPPELEKKVEKAEESLRDTLEKLGKMFGGPDVIKAVAVKNSVVFNPPYTPSLILAIDETGGGGIYTSIVSDETQIKKVEEAGGADAFDKKTGTLTLPSIDPGKLTGSVKLTGMGSAIGGQTFARKVLFNKLGDEFAIDVGFDFFSRSALTGRVLLTPEKRLADFRANSPLAKLTATTPRYKPQGDGTIAYPETSSPFQREKYVAYFSEKRAEQKLTPDDASSDLATWLSSEAAGRGRLSRVGTNAVTYIITKGSTFSKVVIDTEADEIDPVLKKVVLDSDIVSFMKKMAQGQSIEGINFSKLQAELWPHKPNARWLADRFRDYNKSTGMHEWIPSSSIPKTIELAASAATWLKGEQWIDLHHEMRADTKDLIGKPEYWVERLVEGRSVWLPQGHDGAVEHATDGAQTKYFSSNSVFHIELFTNIANCSGLGDCIAGAKKVFEKYIWKSEEPKSPLDPELKIRGAKVTDLQALKADQAARYNALIAKFDGLAGKYKD
jgi:hypothetical protein